MKCPFIGQLIRLLPALMLPLLFPFMTNAATWYVNHAAVGANTGTSWANAFTLLQSALTAAQTGDQIWVAKGTYKPTATNFGFTDRHKTFFINKDVQIYGGFNGSEASPADRPYPLMLTILSGELGAAGNTDNAYHVIWMEYLSPSALLEGFTISGGNGDGADFLEDRGGGIFNYGAHAGSSSNPTIFNCEISGNTADFAGGMYNLGYDYGNASPTLTNCRFLNNVGHVTGGGLDNDAEFDGNSSPILLNCVFSGNTAGNYAGGMVNFGASNGGGGGVSSPVLTNCVFSGNAAVNNGGGIYNSGINGGVSSPTLINCLFFGNVADEGGGMYNSSENGSCAPVLTNCTMTGNKSISVAGGAMRNGTANVTLKNCVLWGNSTEIANIFGATTSVTYSIVQGGHAGVGNLNQNPLFVFQPDFNSAPSTAGDLHLLAGSPAKNSGTAAGAPVFDLDLNPRPAGPGFDMGCYESQSVCTGPKIVCPANMVKNTDVNQCSAVTVYPAPVATDDCFSVTSIPVFGLPSGAPFPKGTTIVIWKATNAQGSTATCSFTVTVNDQQAPTITCPANIVKNTDLNQCSAVTTYTTPLFLDNCTGNNVVRTSGLSSGSQFPKGTTIVHWKTTDASGLIATCSFTVTVNDGQAPAITCPQNINKSTDLNYCIATVTYNQPLVADNCLPAPTLTLTSGANTASGSPFAKGMTTVIWQATDGAGLTATCSFKITVFDGQAPDIACPRNMSKSTDLNFCIATVTYNLPIASDYCPGVTMALQSGLPSGAAFPKGITTVIWKATDAAGLTKTCSFKVTVNDNQAPAIECPVSQVKNTDLNQCSAVVLYDSPIAADYCPGVTVARTSGLPSGAAFPKGVNTVVFKATDASGNFSQCNFTITVNDVQAPVLTCPANLAVTADPGQCNAVVTYTNPTATDNCAPMSSYLLSGLASYSVFPQGVTTNIWKATDESGWTATCMFTVTVSCGAAPGGNPATQTRSEEITNLSRLQTKPDLSLVPNPATAAVNIYMNEIDNQASTLRIFDDLGRIIMQRSLDAETTQVQIDLDDVRFGTGVYTVALQLGEKVVAKRLSVVK